MTDHPTALTIWAGTADLTETGHLHTHPPVPDDAHEVLSAAILHADGLQANTLAALFEQQRAELLADDLHARALRFHALIRELPAAGGPTLHAAATLTGFQTPDGTWLDPIHAEPWDPEESAAELQGAALHLNTASAAVTGPCLTDTIQVLTGGPLADHPLQAPIGVQGFPDVQLNTLAQQVLLAGPGLLRGRHATDPHRPVPHPDGPALIEVQLPPGMTGTTKATDPQYLGRMAIHSMVLPADVLPWSHGLTRPVGATSILVQAVIQEQADTTPDRSGPRPAQLLGVTLRGLDERGYLTGGPVTEFIMQGYQALTPADRWPHMKAAWAELVRDWSGMHLDFLRRLSGHWDAPAEHLTQGGHLVRLVPDECLPLEHATPDIIEKRLSRLITDLKREIPGVLKKLPGLYLGSLPSEADVRALLPEAARNGTLAKRLLTVGVWRLTRGVYLVDETVISALWHDTDPPEDVSTEQLLHLPEHAVYLPIPGRVDATGRAVYGAFLTVTGGAGGRTALLALHTDDDRLTTYRLPVDGQVNVREALERAMREDLPAHHEQLSVRTDRWAQDLVLNILNVALYLCATNAEVHPAQRAPRDRKTGLPTASTVREVGVRLGAAIRHAREATQGPGPASSRAVQGVRTATAPHIRRAHFHTYVHGPRDGVQERRLKWLPPIPVNMDLGEDVPVTVRAVEA